MEGAEIFSVFGGGVDAVIDADGADGEIVAEAGADGVAEAWVIGGAAIFEAPGVGEGGTAEGAGDGEIEFGVEDGEDFPAEGIIVGVAGAELAFGEAADGVGAAVEVEDIDGEIIGNGGDVAAASAEGEEGFSEGEIVREAGIGAEESGGAVDGGEVEGGGEDEAASRDNGVIAVVGTLGEAESLEGVLGGTEILDGDGLVGDRGALALGEDAEFEVGEGFTGEIDAPTVGGFVVAHFVALFGEDAGAEDKMGIEEPRIDVEEFAADAALGVLGGEGEGATVAEEIEITDAEAGEGAVVGAIAEGEAEDLGFGFGESEIPAELIMIESGRGDAKIFEEASAEEFAINFVEFLGLIDLALELAEAAGEEVFAEARDFGFVVGGDAGEGEARSGADGESDGDAAVGGGGGIGMEEDFGLEVAFGFVEGLEVMLHGEGLALGEGARDIGGESGEEERTREEELAGEVDFAEGVAGSFVNLDGDIGLGTGGVEGGRGDFDGDIEEAFGDVEAAEAIDSGVDFGDGVGESGGIGGEALGGGADEVFEKIVGGDGGVIEEGEGVEEGARAFGDFEEEGGGGDLVIDDHEGEAIFSVERGEEISGVVGGGSGEAGFFDVADLGEERGAELIGGEGFLARELEGERVRGGGIGKGERGEEERAEEGEEEGAESGWRGMGRH